MADEATNGVIGGSGVYELLQDARPVTFGNPYGKTSSPLMIGRVADKSVAFISRHGQDHSIPPHLVNYRANIFAFHKVGVRNIISSGAVGSLRLKMKPGHIVITDQFIDRTKNRPDTYVEGPKVEHLAAADLYCDNLRSLSYKSCKKLGYHCHRTGTVVVINGPRFSSRAESLWYKKMGWDILSMTQYPENVLAAELGMCYCNIGLVTDYDAGMEENPEIEAVTWEQIKKVLENNANKFKQIVSEVIKKLPNEKSTPCPTCSNK